MVYGETGRTNIAGLIKTKMMVFWLHLEQLPDSRYSKIFLELAKKLTAVNLISSNWLNFIRDAFGETGISFALDCPALISKKSLRDFLKTIFKDWNIQEWHSNLEISSKTVCYKEKIRTL